MPEAALQLWRVHVSYSEPSSPGAGPLIFGALFPAAVILIELASGLCANTFFDPLPTISHLLLVAAVPLINFLLWRAAQHDEPASRRLSVAAGVSIVVSAAYVLLMLPILPIAAIGIIFVGIGLIGFAPLFTLVYAFRWASLTAPEATATKDVGIGVAAGLLLLMAADVPASATYLALKDYAAGGAKQENAVTLARSFGDRELLLRRAYGDTGRATGLVSFLLSSWGDPFTGGMGSGTEHARELYFRVTGEPFNAAPPLTDGLAARRRWLMAWDEDQGGESVGGRVPGLALASSRIDGSIANADNLGYFEWTWEVANSGDRAHEARFTLALPEGAVASRATLWVNGEPREASVAARSAVRAAYASVVRRQRDPLLVTTDGSQRLLVQAFPIAAGTSMKLRVGFTAPFELAPDGRRSLPLPAIVDRNFEIGAHLRHGIWIDADGRIAGRGLRAVGSTLRGEVPDAQLLAMRPRILADRLRAPSVQTGRVSADGKLPAITVRQVIAPAAPGSVSALMIVLDGSSNNRAASAELRKALAEFPGGTPVGLVIADAERVKIAPAPWSPEQAARFDEAIEAAPFRGGQDNIPALVEALEAARGETGSILWIHGPQPVAFLGSRASLDQLLERDPVLPRLIRYQPVAGRAFTISGNPWFETAKEIVPSADVKGDLRRVLSSTTGAAPSWRVTRSVTAARSDKGSRHIARLWAAGQIAAQGGAVGERREAAIELARRLNLVTPLSGAVVLETDKDYDANGLPVPSAEEVPTVPEPGTWALLIALALFAAWLLRQRSRAAFA
jgi:hypothetical protein